MLCQHVENTNERKGKKLNTMLSAETQYTMSPTKPRSMVLGPSITLPLEEQPNIPIVAKFAMKIASKNYKLQKLSRKEHHETYMPTETGTPPGTPKILESPHGTHKNHEIPIVTN